MPVRFQKMIYRQNLQDDPETLYVFGDNCWREGKGGQAKEMRGEPNARGIRTKEKPSQQPDSWWSDRSLTWNCERVMNDFLPIIEHLQKGGNVVFPTDGLGTGLSELPKRGPKTLQFIEMLTAFCTEI